MKPSTAWMKLLLCSFLIHCSSEPPEPGKTSLAEPKISAQENLSGEGPLRVKLTNKVVRSEVKHFGMNLTQFEHWGTGQILANLVGRNPGFEGHIYRSIVEVSQKGTDKFGDQGPSGAWDTGFWDQADFEVLWGKSKGRTGIITGFKRGPNGGSYSCSPGTPAFEVGDQVVLRSEQAQPGTLGWWTQTGGQARILVELGQPRPGSPGKQSLRLEAPAPSDRLELKSYFDEPRGDRAQAPLSGPHVLSFWAKAMVANTQLDVSLTRHLTPNRHFLQEQVEIQSDWQEFRLAFTGEQDLEPAMVELAFRLKGGICLIDDVSLAADSGSGPFRPEVLGLLKPLQPGILRYWAGQLGDSLENQLAPPFAQRMSGFSRWAKEPKVVGYNLHDFLQLCEQLGAEAWYVVPLTFSQAERKDLIEYLAGPGESRMGRIRANLGHPAPWTESLKKIHLEVGNEAWNDLFRGGILQQPQVYGQVGETFLAEMAGWSGSSRKSFDFILGGQAVAAGRNAQILSQAQAYDSLAIAPYLLHKLDRGGSEIDTIGTLFSEVTQLEKQGYLQENRANLGPGKRLAVYEVNLHTINGTAGQEALLKLTPSAGAGVAVSCHMLNLLALWNVRDQCFYNFNQFDFMRGDTHESVRLWGAIRDLAIDGRKRPQYLALELLNKALNGNLIQVQVSGKQQSYQAPHGQTISNPLRLFYFVNGSQHALLALNLDPTAAVAFAVEAETSDIQAVNQTSLIFSHPSDHNEDGVNVRLETSPLAGLAEGDGMLHLPAAGMALYEWQQ